MKITLSRLLLAAAFLAAPLVTARAEPFPLKLHKKVRGEVRETLGIDRDRGNKRRDRDYHHRNYRHGHDYDRRYRGGYYYAPARPLYYQDPYYDHYGYGYGSSLTIQRTVVERPVYRRTQEKALTLEQRVQIELAEEGFYRGAIDGIIGPGTRAAIRRYQHEEGLRITGRIDRDLLDELGLI